MIHRIYRARNFPDHFFYACFFEQGAVFTFSLQQHEDDKRKVLKRFTAVFSLTFRRFLDLKQAEAQAREAQIEAALERVRATNHGHAPEQRPVECDQCVI
jgi:hypothetical protein